MTDRIPILSAVPSGLNYSFHLKVKTDYSSLVTSSIKTELFKTKTRNYLPSGKGLNESEVLKREVSLGSSADKDIKYFRVCVCVCVCGCVTSNAFSLCVPFISFFTTQVFIEHLHLTVRRPKYQTYQCQL